MEKRENLSQNAKGNKNGKKNIDMDHVLSDIDFGRKSIAEICQEYGIDRKTLWRRFQEHKSEHPEDEYLQKRKSLCDGKRHPQYKSIDMEKAYQLLDSGLSVKQVCEIVGCSKKTLYKKFKQYEQWKETL